MSHDPVHPKSNDTDADHNGRLDQASRIVIQRFFCTLLVIVLWFLLQTDKAIGSVVAAAGAGAALFSALFAFVLQEKFCAASLNRWDEAIGYVGIVALGHAFSVI